jgi:7-cyano-7-deazaguanine synthase
MNLFLEFRNRFATGDLHRLLQENRRVVPVYVRCGLRWEAAELFWLRDFLWAIRTGRLAPLVVVDVPLRSTYGRHWSLVGRRVPGAASADAAVYLPGRNLLLIAHAAIACRRLGVRALALGTLKGNPFGDASSRFFARLAGCLQLALGEPFRVHAPLARCAKPELIRSARGVPLALTFSCLAPAGRRHCGRCNKCAERQRAFRAAGVTDPTDYSA